MCTFGVWSAFLMALIGKCRINKYTKKKPLNPRSMRVICLVFWLMNSVLCLKNASAQLIKVEDFADPFGAIPFNKNFIKQHQIKAILMDKKVGDKAKERPFAHNYYQFDSDGNLTKYISVIGKDTNSISEYIYQNNQLRFETLYHRQWNKTEVFTYFYEKNQLVKKQKTEKKELKFIENYSYNASKQLKKTTFITGFDSRITHFSYINTNKQAKLQHAITNNKTGATINQRNYLYNDFGDLVAIRSKTEEDQTEYLFEYNNQMMFSKFTFIKNEKQIFEKSFHYDTRGFLLTETQVAADPKVGTIKVHYKYVYNP